MTTLTDQLRAMSRREHDDLSLGDEAADEIERLRDAIKRQAAAAKTGMDAATRISSVQLEQARIARAESSPDAIDSERNANAVLTGEVERLRAELAAAKREYREGGQILSPCARDSAMSVISGEEWARRFKARIIARLLEPGPSPWTREQAEQIAQDEYEATDCWPALSGHENSPEDAADETLSYWGDGADG